MGAPQTTEPRRAVAQEAKSRLQKHQGVRSEVVLEAALDLFSRQEYKEVTVQRIARSIGITHSLIYYYYSTKEHLFHAALVHALGQVMVEIDKIKAAHTDPVALLGAWFRMNIDKSEMLTRLVRIMFVNASTNKQSTPEIVERIIREFYALEESVLVEGISAGVRDGVFTCGSAEATANFISKCIDGIYYGALVRKDTDIAQAMSALEDVTWTLLNHEPGRPGKAGGS